MQQLAGSTPAKRYISILRSLEMKTITKKQIEQLKKTNHAVHIYPRKKIVRVDGHKCYKLS